MWRYVGVVRNEKDMKKALKEINKIKKIPLKCGKKLKMNEKLIAALDVQNMVPTCEIIIKSALYRKESRGAHYREDYKKTKRKWVRNIICVPTKKGIKITTRKIEKIPKEIKKYLNLKPKVQLSE